MAKYYIFRNQTVEPLFGEEGFAYSGYGDISVIPEEVSRYIWFYQVPFNADSRQLAAETATYADKLRYVVEHTHGRELWIMTLVNLFRLRLTGTDKLVDDAVAKFNSEAWRMAKEHSNVRVIDFTEFTSRYAEEELVSWKYYFMSQTQLSFKLAKDFAAWFSRKEEEILLKRKKCLVVDLDNTLWGGTLDENGPSGIEIGGDYPGNAYLLWQQSLLELEKTGVILAVCSKNNEEDVMEVWDKNPFCVLRQEHFSAWRINWRDKATNLRELSAELNIGLDSMVFVDDNPAERELVRQALPMVAVPDFPRKPFDLMPFFRDLSNRYFRIYDTTYDDLNKTQQYKSNALRNAEKSNFSDMTAYLRSLGMEIEVMPADEYNISRIAQMTQKTNQYNLTTRRMTEQEIRECMSDGWRIYCINVCDRFGDCGISGAVFITGDCHIDNLLMSCRILGRGIEAAFVKFVLNRLRQEGIKRVTAAYVASARNMQTACFYDSLGFVTSASEDNIKKYIIDLTRDFPIDDFYKIKMK